MLEACRYLGSRCTAEVREDEPPHLRVRLIDGAGAVRAAGYTAADAIDRFRRGLTPEDLAAAARLLTLEEVEARVEELRAGALLDYGDAELHESEDRLRDDVLLAVSEGSEIARDLARAVVQTTRFEFARWYA